MGWRMSSLPIAQYCGQSPRLGEQHAAGMAALQSSCFHAKLAGDTAWEAMYTRLPEKQQQELDEWKDPDYGDISIRGLDNPHWSGRPDFFERELALNSSLETQLTCVTDPTPLTVGHADMLWHPRRMGGKEIAIVCDAKRTRWTSNLDSLQLDAYGWAWAKLCGADGYMVGLYILEDGEWQWRKKPVLFASVEAAEIADRLIVAANNQETVIGPHCSDCYQCGHCPEFMLPVVGHAVSAGSLGWEAIDTLSDGGEITPRIAPHILRLKKAAQELVKLTDTRIKAYVQEHGHIVENGKKWGPSGGGNKKETLDKKKLVERLEKRAPRLLKEYTRHGLTGPTNRWVNA